MGQPLDALVEVGNLQLQVVLCLQVEGAAAGSLYVALAVAGPLDGVADFDEEFAAGEMFGGEDIDETFLVLGVAEVDGVADQTRNLGVDVLEGTRLVTKRQGVSC